MHVVLKPSLNSVLKKVKKFNKASNFDILSFALNIVSVKEKCKNTYTNS